MLDKVGVGLERYMDLVSVRQRTVASNIANAETPNYHTRDIDFTSELGSAIDGHRPETIETAGLPAKTDGNNVSLDREMRLLSENAIRFQIASSLLKAQIREVKLAIQEGRNA